MSSAYRYPALTPPQSRLLNKVLFDTIEQYANQRGRKGFRPEDARKVVVKTPTVGTLLQGGYISLDSLKTRVSQTLGTRTEKGRPIFMRVSQERPGTWKASGYCSADEVEVAAHNRHQFTESVVRKTDLLLQAVHEMRQSGVNLDTAWSQVI